MYNDDNDLEINCKYIYIVTHMKFRVVSGIFTVLSYIGQCDLHNTYFGLL